MSTVAWHLEYSVEVEVSASLAWTFWTDIRNWDDPPAHFELDGPFAVGARGKTLIPDREPLRWRILRAIVCAQNEADSAHRADGR